jgi:hypothetical protein
MKPYIIRFRKRNSEERTFFIEEFVTFAEATSWSFMKSSKMGHGWYIEAVSEK